MQTVLLTGAASGIGRQAALQFAAAGWRVLAVDRDGDGLAALTTALTPDSVQSFVVDLADPAQIERLRDIEFTIHAVVNNAGMSDASGTPLVDQPPLQIDRLLALNLYAPARIFEAVRHKLAAGARVVNVSSGAGLKAIPFRGAYSPSKAGLIAQTAALEKAEPQLAVTCLCPGFVRTELVENLIAAGRLDPVRAVSKIPLGRMASPAEMARAMLFLASSDAAPLSGQTFVYDGGSSIYGGSAHFALSEREVTSPEAGTRYTLVGAPEGWASALPGGSGTYPALIDFSPLEAPAGELTKAVWQAATRFAEHHRFDASLTLVLPAESAEAGNWAMAGDVAAAEMLVRTLACEFGASGRRINALRMDGTVQDRAALLAFIAGVEAQFLTGQILAA